MRVPIAPETKKQLSVPMDPILAGEDVLITRHQYSVMELKSVQAPTRVVSLADLDWLAVRRVGQVAANGDAGSLVSEMRDDDER